MIFGLVAVVVIIAAGGGIDIARAVSMKTRLASALDAAALAVGTQLDLDEEELEDMAQKYFDANYPDSALGDTFDVDLEQNGEKISLSVTGTVDTLLLKIININQFDLNITNEVTRSANNIEVSLVLDVTNSMSGQRLADLKVAAKDMVDLIVQDVQTPYYTKMAIVPYSNAVNVSSTYADSVRGSIAGPKTITAAAWQTGTAKNITGITKGNNAVVTAVGHGFVTGDKIWISGVSGMTQINNRPFIVGTVPSADTFQIRTINDTNNINTSSYDNYSSSANDFARKCVVPTVGVSCQVKVTSYGHGFANGDHVVVSGVSGMTEINTGTNATWVVSQADSDGFVLDGTMPSGTNPFYQDYVSGGNAYCTVQGCAYLRFRNPGNNYKVFPISTCVSERDGDEAFTDAAPSTASLGRNYHAASPMASTTNPCTTPTITPLSTNKTTLKSQVDALAAGGSSGGHVGIAWGWYLLSPNFGSLWPASAPAAYGEDHLFKILVLMTDGEYNSSYCNGVIAQDSTSGSGSSNDHINCNGPKGHSYVQSDALCDAMKASGKDVIVYTVGFDVYNSTNAQNLVADCATDSEHAYYPNTGAELKAAFQLIAQEISQLRLSE